MQELDPCRKLTVLRAAGMQRVGGLSQLRKIWRTWNWKRVRTENRGGQ